MNEHVSDMELERYLRRRDRLSQEYAALESEAPSAELDARVLERARQALDQETGHPFWRRANWPRITALAATVVLSFALVVRLAIDNDMLLPAAAPQTRPMTPIEAELATSADAAQPMPPSDDVRYGSRQDGAGVAAFERDTARTSALPVNVVGSREAPPQAIAPNSATLLRTSPRQAPADDSALAAAGEGPVQIEESAGATVASARPLQKEEAAALPLSDEARQRLERRDAALAKRAAEQTPRDLSMQEQKTATPASPRESRPPEDEVHAESTAADDSHALVVTGTNVNQVKAAAAKRDPQEWYEEIARLRAAGRTEEADREMEKLRAAHPDFEPAPVPARAR